MAIDVVALRDAGEALQMRLDRSSKMVEVHGIYLALAPLIGAIQGAVGTCRSAGGSDAAAAEAEEALQRLKATARQVGADIRLASPAALTLGLQAALDEALRAVDALERSLA